MSDSAIEKPSLLPLPQQETTDEPKWGDYFVELRFGRYRQIDGKTERMDSASIYQGSLTKQLAEAKFWPAYDHIVKVAALPLSEDDHDAR